MNSKSNQFNSIACILNNIRRNFAQISNIKIKPKYAFILIFFLFFSIHFLKMFIRAFMIQAHIGNSQMVCLQMESLIYMLFLKHLEVM